MPEQHPAWSFPSDGRGTRSRRPARARDGQNPAPWALSTGIGIRTLGESHGDVNTLVSGIRRGEPRRG